MYEAGAQGDRHSASKAAARNAQNEQAQQQHRPDRNRQDRSGDDSAERGSRDFARGREHGVDHAMNMAELALRGANALLDIQMTTAQTFWQFQARSAAALGAPDYSDLLRATQLSARRLLSSGTEQALMCARRATQSMNEMQTQVGKIVEQGAAHISEELQTGFEALAQHTEQGLQVANSIARRSAAQQTSAGNAGDDESSGNGSGDRRGARARGAQTGATQHRNRNASSAKARNGKKRK